MTNSSPPPQPPQQEGFKSLAIKGIIGAVTLVGTTAIPITVNRVLNPPSPDPAATPSPSVSAPASSPAPTAQASPASVAPQTANENSPAAIDAGSSHEDDPGKKKGKKKKD